jgi:SAM-dependent methyltransferase
MMTDDSLEKLDQSLAQRYGAYASYAHETDPILVKTYGDGAADEVDRLLDIFATPESQVLDLGCGAGFTLCRLASKVDSIWGFDQDKNLLDAARRRVANAGFTNVTFIKGNDAVTEDVATLPDKNFDLILSRRGPNVNQALLPKLKSDAVVIQELWQDPVGLLEMFGRKTFHGDLGDNPNWLVDEYSWLDLFPVSVKEYYFDSFFRNASHLVSYLSQKTSFYSWTMPPTPYVEAIDREALDLYARYNTTPEGIRVLNHRKVYLFRRMLVHHAPARPDLKPRP